MSVTGIASSLFSILSGSQNTQQSTFSSEFQQLGQDVQSGNLSQAQQDFAAFTQSLTGAGQPATTAAGTGGTVSQAINQLGQDLQQGNLPAAQQDFSTLQQDLQQSSQQAGGAGHHHHHHHLGNAGNSQQSSPIAQEFGQLGQSLQSGNLQGAQQAFSSLLNDLQQGTDSALSSAAAQVGSGLSVSV